MTDKMRAGILRALARFARDEEGSLHRLRMRQRLSFALGCLILLVAFSLAFQESDLVAPWIYTLAAAFGGVCLGLATWFDSSLATWPVMRDYLDLERLRNTQ
jgi:hypothetical protein